MSQWTNGPITLDTSETMAEHRLVKLDRTTTRSAIYADAGDAPVGVVTHAVLTSGDPVKVVPLVKEGTVKMTASGAVAVNTLVYPAADGKISNTPAGMALGVALEAATGDGSIIEVLPIPTNPGDWKAGPGVHGFFADFTANSLDDDILVVTASDSGAAAHADGAGGVISLGPSDSTAADNDEIYLHQTLETFKFAAGKPAVFMGRMSFTEANTDDANVIFGVKDAWAANALQDNGGGPAASYSGATIFKVDGGTVWQAEASIASTQDTDTNCGTRSSGSYQTFRIEFDPGSGATAGVVRFFIDGALVHTATSFNYTSATDMELGCGVKNGGANEETLSIDYLAGWQIR